MNTPGGGRFFNRIRRAVEFQPRRLPPPAARASWVWLPFLLLSGLIILSWEGNPSRADSLLADLQVCRAWVQPCQNVVGIAPGDMATLDLRLQVTGISRVQQPVKLVAWETHFTTTGPPTTGVALRPTGGRPVQERGDGDYVLNGLSRLQDRTDGRMGRYFTIQNRHDPDSSSLDYSITLLDFAEPGATTAGIPLANGGPFLLGRIALQGTADGEVGILAAEPSENSSQFVLLDRRGGTTTIRPNGSESPLARVRVGKDVESGEVRGQVTSQYPEELQDRSWLPMPLSVSFWPPGAIPPWRRGNAAPLATFSKLSTDRDGWFRVTDISASLLPAGIYDLRASGPGALSGLAPRVVVPAPDDSSQPPPQVRLRLRWGDTDGNNVVDRRDLADLRAAFGQLRGADGYIEVADLNRDRVIDGLDFSLMARNLGKRGQ